MGYGQGGSPHGDAPRIGGPARPAGVKEVGATWVNAGVSALIGLGFAAGALSIVAVAASPLPVARPQPVAATTPLPHPLKLVATPAVGQPAPVARPAEAGPIPLARPVADAGTPAVAPVAQAAAPNPDVAMIETASDGPPAPVIPVARVAATPFTDGEGVLASQGLLDAVRGTGPIQTAYQRTPASANQDRDFLGLIGLNLRLPPNVGPVEAPAVGSTRPAETLTVKRGQTLMAMLADAGLSWVEADLAVRALRPVFDPRRLAIGQQLSVQLYDGTQLDENQQLARLVIELDVAKEVELTRDDDGALVAVTVEKPLYPRLRTAVLDIQSSLYAAASGTDLPDAVMHRAVRVLSYQVDFQRDIQPGDRLELLYEQKLTRTGEVAENGDVLMARLSVNGDQINVYRYIDSYGDPDYFDEQGKSLRSGLMRTPIEGARLSSGFGSRRHPILGYNKMHKGVDFAAPTGTPIFAAGNGVIERIGWFSGYGRYVRIRHTDTISTAYAHLSRFTPGLTRGRRVKQGEVIGRVGSTGRSTGPHLHYEVIQSGRQVNPLSVTLTAGRELQGQELARFQQVRATLDQQHAGTMPFNQLAESRR